MKKIILTLGVVATVFTACDFSPKYTINGSIQNNVSDKVFLKEFKDNTPVIVDSASVVDNTFIFKGKIDKTKKLYLFTDKNAQRPIVGLYVENTDMTINIDNNDPNATVITGGKAQDLANKFGEIDKKFEEDTKPLNDKYMALIPKKEELGKKFEEEVSILRDEYIKLADNAQEANLSLIKENLSSVVSADKFTRYFSKLKLEDAREITNSFTGEAADCESIIKLKERIAIIDNVAVGKPAPDFKLASPSGEMISPSMFKGKVLIIDFWASWCGPCRGENPNVVKMYKKFHEKGLEILSVSLDDNKDKWTKAIAEDGLIWNHVSDLKGWNSEAAKLYGVTGIPHIVLLDKDGIIIAKNLRGEELETKLNEIIK